MKLQKAPITNCHSNQIGFPRRDNGNINFVNNSSQHENEYQSHISCSVQWIGKFQSVLRFSAYHNNIPHLQFIQRCQNAINDF